MTRIGIGAGNDPGKILQSSGKTQYRDELIIYARPGVVRSRDIPAVIGETPWDLLVSDLVSGKIDAAIRGTLPANETLAALRRATGVSRLERIALLETSEGQKFFLAPVGVDEGSTIGERVAFAKKGREMAQRFGLSGKVGILSGGRYGDIGRDKRVDRSLADAEIVAKLSGATHYEILIEEAIRECGTIIAPDGISGNLIFRTLVFLGGGTGHGAPVVNIGRIFVDTSRASPDYANAIMLAHSLANED